MPARPVRKKRQFNLKPWIFLIIMVVAAGITYLLATNRITLFTRANTRVDTILVKFRPPVDENAIEALSNSAAIQQVDAIPALGIRVMKIPDNQEAEVVAERMSHNPLVEFAEPNAIVAPEILPNDPSFGTTGNTSTNWHHYTIKSILAWDNAKADNILIGVCDTGFEDSHDDLKDTLRADLGWNAVDGTNNWQRNSTLTSGHGTYVAGLAAATTNNTLGTAGVAWGAKIIPVRISNQTDGSAYVSDAAKCIQYSSDKGARSINLSYRMAHSAAIDTAGQYALSRGAVVAVAAGNDGTNQTWTDWSGFLSVASITGSEQKASSSNTGTFVDIAAPGNAVYTTRIGNTYGYASGTSMSSPVAAGVIALVAGANPTLSGNQIQNIILNTARDAGDPGEDPIFGRGIVDANKAVISALNNPDLLDVVAPVTNITTPTQGSTVSPFTMALSAESTDAVGVFKVDFFVDGTKVGISDYIAPYTTTVSTQNYAIGSTHTATAIGYDLTGNAGPSQSVTFTIRDTGDTVLPAASISSPVSGAVLTGSVPVSSLMTDNVGIYAGGYKIDSTNFGGFSNSSGSQISKQHTATLNTLNYSNGDHTLTVYVTDTNRNTFTSQPIQITISNAGGTIPPPTPTPTYAPVPTSTPFPTATPTKVPTPTVSVNDTTPPSVSITSPQNGSTVIGNVSIKANATDNVGVIRMEIFIDNTMKTSSGGSSISTNWNSKAKNVSNGSHTISVKAYDTRGNVGTSSVTVTK